MKAVFDDGSYIIGDRTWKCKLNESQGTHHLIVKLAHGIEENGVIVDTTLVGQEIAIPISKPKYWSW